MTRSFLAKVEADCPRLPILALSDFDPDGLNIFSCYRYGSRGFSHESSNVKLNIARLGILSKHLGSLHRSGVVLGGMAQSSLLPADSLIEMTARDMKYAVGLLRKTFQAGSSDDDCATMRRDLQTMLMLGVKAEIQAVDNFGDISDWLDSALLHSLLFD